jgi:hypothetical protein
MPLKLVDRGVVTAVDQCPPSAAARPAFVGDKKVRKI